MAKLLLENATDTLNLNEVAETGTGMQATTGMTGLGLPPVSTQWLEGAGDGAIYRRTRVLSRDIDVPLDIVGRDRADLAALLSRLARVLSGPCKLRLVMDDDSDWSIDVIRVGGGDYEMGSGRDLQTVITLRAGDPYWTSSKFTNHVIGGDAGGTTFLSGLVKMPVASSQAIGSITLENTGDVAAYPVWTIYGPGNNFKAVSPNGETLYWKGTLLAGQTLTIDTRKGLVVREDGSNQYAKLDTAPRFWAVEPGTATCTAEMLDVTPASKIVCSFQPRKWMVI
ncbi:minor tail protein [Streptomyces phage Yosif]|uniref:Minor tail protein n=1 Tax=Streptomyces phage Yosif TaxID=2201421 RepID=A0A2Z4QBW6_9CAUD|nr:minor tail protein [Streptomyces phage Yosif]AWY07584.1 minor tail protein [Streptomyces phage Yosif]